MSDPNTTINDIVSGSPSHEAIVQWKDSVYDFFSGEWDNLRELIRRLEEESWDEPLRIVPRLPQTLDELSESDAVEPVMSAATLTTVPATVNVPTAKPESKAAVKPAAIAELPTETKSAAPTGRLAELAKQIEARLNRKDN